MDQQTLERSLVDLPLGSIRYYDQVGSTNDQAARWIAEGAPNLSLILADEQTAGRGRSGRQWITPRGVALAVSVVLYPTLEDSDVLPRMMALGALAICDALRNTYRLPAQIKWPNDVILNRRKVAGVLAEAQWTGSDLAAVVLGLGINVASASVDGAVLPASALRFPATSVEDVLGRPVDRLEMLRAVLVEFLRWRKRMGWPDFVRAWESRLAFRGEWVQVFSGRGSSDTGALPLLREGQIAGLTPDGSLKLTVRSGDVVTVQFGEVRLSPLKSEAG